jgi:hypothetical protein
MIIIVSDTESSGMLLFTNRRVRWVILQNRNKIVNALHNAENTFIMNAAFSADENIVNKCPIIMNKGAPGGCPTSSLYADSINSLQSQRLAVGSTVDM